MEKNTGATDISRLSKVQRFIEDILTKEGVLAKDIRICAIAFDEIFSNVCHYSKAKEVTVECGVEKDKITVAIKDDGMAFNPLEMPAPDMAKPLESRKIGGLGIYIVKKLMDEVTYKRADEKNRLTMVFYASSKRRTNSTTNFAPRSAACFSNVGKSTSPAESSALSEMARTTINGRPFK